MALHSQQRVDYNRIAHLYDEPLRDHVVDPNLLRFLEDRPGLEPNSVRVLDMGSGTGKQLAADRQAFPDATLVGLDLFAGMLQQAHKRSQAIAWVQGDNASPPFRDESFDYVTNQFSYHHVLDRGGMLSAVFRILRQGGRFVMTNLDPWSMPGWIVYTYFPAAWERDRKDFLTVAEFARLLERVGFSQVQIRRQHRREGMTLGSFLAYAAQRFRTSQLVAINDSEYKIGISKLGKEIEKWGEQVHVDSEICVVTVTGEKCP